ncbi:unnamed protein product [Rotaria socialis]|nr:unnamed protein product [Rotaria socialis]
MKPSIFAGRRGFNEPDTIPYARMQELAVKLTTSDDDDYNNEKYEPDDGPKIVKENSPEPQNELGIRAATIYPRSNLHIDKTGSRRK